MAAATVARMAMNPSVLSKIGHFLKGDMPMKQFLLQRLGLDAGIAAFQGATTPGGLDEKLIAGLTDFGLSAGSGLVAGGAARRMGADQLTEGTADMMASFAGGFAAYPAGNALIRAKDSLTGGPGMTSFEKMAQEDQKKMVEQIQQQTLQAAGYLPGMNSPAYDSNYLANLGLA